MDLQEKYVQRIENFKNEIKNNKKSYSIISLLRLISVILIIFYAYSFIEKGYSVFNLLGGVFSIMLFIYLLIQHSHITIKLKKLNDMIEINEKNIKRINGQWTKFQDSAQEVLDINHAYSKDLDIFGEKSLFQLINTTKTFLGRNKLINLLRNPEKNIEKIRKRQGAVKELAEKTDFCQRLECEGISKEKSSKDPKDLFEYTEKTGKLFKSIWAKFIVYLLPVILIGCIGTIVFLKLWNYLYVISMFLVVHIILNAIGYKKITPILNSIYKFNKDIDSYASILELIQKEEFKDEYLNEVKAALFIKDTSALKGIKELDKIVQNINLRYNMAFAFINIILLWDYKCLFQLENWKECYGHSMRRWLNVISEFESLSSLSVLLQLNPSWSFPSFKEDGLVFTAEGMGHPLIREEKCVCNDVNMTDSIFIITGSNMSGKTTLLRTIGINLVLAYAGAPVCAKHFQCSLMDIFTSMRISDDLNEGISTFYAELMRIKIIIDNLKRKEPMVFLVDEIFRGTNSKDRIIGSKNVLKNLNKDWVIGAISTHDFELCDLEFDDKARIKNYHFTENYSNNEILFDYKLRLGRSKTTNAKYLMKMVGIEIIE